MQSKNKGFTLIELVISMAVVATLIGVAMPSFTSLIATQKVKTAASNLQSSLLLTRSESLKRNGDATLSPSVTGQWTTGWSISAQSTSVSVSGPVSGVTIAGPSTVTFQSSGRLPTGSTDGVFKVSSTNTPDYRCVSISVSGVPRVMSSGC